MNRSMRAISLVLCIWLNVMSVSLAAQDEAPWYSNWFSAAKQAVAPVGEAIYDFVKNNAAISLGSLAAIGAGTGLGYYLYNRQQPTVQPQEPTVQSVQEPVTEPVVEPMALSRIPPFARQVAQPVSFTALEALRRVQQEQVPAAEAQRPAREQKKATQFARQAPIASRFAAQAKSYEAARAAAQEQRAKLPERKAERAKSMQQQAVAVMNYTALHACPEVRLDGKALFATEHEVEQAGQLVNGVALADMIHTNVEGNHDLSFTQAVDYIKRGGALAYQLFFEPQFNVQTLLNKNQDDLLDDIVALNWYFYAQGYNKGDTFEHRGFENGSFIIHDPYNRFFELLKGYVAMVNPDAVLPAAPSLKVVYSPYGYKRGSSHIGFFKKQGNQTEGDDTYAHFGIDIRYTNDGAELTVIPDWKNYVGDYAQYLEGYDEYIPEGVAAAASAVAGAVRAAASYVQAATSPLRSLSSSSPQSATSSPSPTREEEVAPPQGERITQHRLPSQNSHILFGKKATHEVFVKPEPHGLYFWDGFTGHALAFLQSVGRKTPGIKEHMVGDDAAQNRKERVPDELKREAKIIFSDARAPISGEQQKQILADISNRGFMAFLEHYKTQQAVYEQRLADYKQRSDNTAAEKAQLQEIAAWLEGYRQKLMHFAQRYDYLDTRIGREVILKQSDMLDCYYYYLLAQGQQDQALFALLNAIWNARYAAYVIYNFNLEQPQPELLEPARAVDTQINAIKEGLAVSLVQPISFVASERDKLQRFLSAYDSKINRMRSEAQTSELTGSWAVIPRHTAE